jgi:predicted KAP-like P-loop ATPase
MWSDIETSTDLLGYNVHANLIKQVIMEKRNLPVTIGLYGDWGSGKSSILKMLQENIENGADSKDTSVVIYFDGWSFESFDDAKMALIQGIVEKLESNKKFKAAVKEKVQKAAKDAKEKIFSMRTLLWTMKNVVAPIGMAYLSNGTSLIADIANFFRSSFNTEDRKKELAEKLTGEDAENFLTKAFHTHIKPDQFSAIREFREVFAKLINATEKDRIVVLIDDLDRCLPENIISNLEAIKLFLNVEKTGSPAKFRV